MQETNNATYGCILNVDSEPFFRKEVVDYLEDSGFTAFGASNGEEALSIFREKAPDLVLSALPMPVENGLELLDAIRKESPETPVIVMSGKDAMMDVIEALRFGASDYIAKPIQNMAVLEHAVCKALERGRLVTENKKYRQELEEKNMQLTHSFAQLKEDQDAGKSVQQQLLPKTHKPFGNYIFSHKVLPSLYLSGDFVDYFAINAEKVGFYIADVSGHGASSAFVTILLKSIVEQILANYQTGLHDTILHPEKVLKYVSDGIFDAHLGKYLTMVYGVLDLKSDTLSYSVGGHYPGPLLWDGGQTIFLQGEGMAVGIIKNAKFSVQTIPFPAASTLALFSDGIFEIMKEKSLEAKEKILCDLLSSSDVKIEDILHTLGLDTQSEFPDDITLLLVNRVVN